MFCAIRSGQQDIALYFYSNAGSTMYFVVCLHLVEKDKELDSTDRADKPRAFVWLTLGAQTFSCTSLSLIYGQGVSCESLDKFTRCYR